MAVVLVATCHVFCLSAAAAAVDQSCLPASSHSDAQSICYRIASSSRVTGHCSRKACNLFCEVKSERLDTLSESCLHGPRHAAPFILGTRQLYVASKERGYRDIAEHGKKSEGFRVSADWGGGMASVLSTPVGVRAQICTFRVKFDIFYRHRTFPVEVECYNYFYYTAR